MKETATFLSWAVSCSQGQVSSVSPWNTKSRMSPLVPRRWSLAVPQEVICFPRSQDGPYLAVVSETKALTDTLLAWLLIFYLKLKFSNS